MSESKNYILTESELKRLIEAAVKWDYHEMAGVDNWGGADYVWELLREEGFDDFEEITELELKSYKELE